MPEDLAFHQQLMLEFVKSQYGAVVLGVLTFPILGISIAALIAPSLEMLFGQLSNAGEEAIKKLNPLQQLLLLVFPAMAPVLIGSTLGREAAEKVKELKLGERVLSFKWILGMFG